MELEQTFKAVKAASRQLAFMDRETCDKVLEAVADAIGQNADRILDANRQDLARMEASNPLYDRLCLNAERLKSIADDMRHVATLPSPLGKIQQERTLRNGLRLCRVSVPFGVIGIVYEARPNVTFDVFSLCLKSGNACILKGGKDADTTNRTSVALIREVLRRFGLPEDAVTLLPATREATSALLQAVGYVDLVIPRGSKRLITFVRDTARVPVIETGAGVVSTYLDKAADMKIAPQIICNGKTRRVSVCNALDCLIVHQDRLPDLYRVCQPLEAYHVTIYADQPAWTALTGKYPEALLQPADSDTFGTEFMDYKLAVKTVGSCMEAIDHIARYDSGHSEAIITDDRHTAQLFQKMVDAACVYWNAPTSFTDGAQFGMGAEIGISTQKLGARGPMALEEITTYKWLIEGEGQIRERS